MGADAIMAKPRELPFDKLTRIFYRIRREVLRVVSVTCNVSNKPPSTIEEL